VLVIPARGVPPHPVSLGAILGSLFRTSKTWKISKLKKGIGSTRAG